MNSRLVTQSKDPIQRKADQPIRVTFDGQELTGEQGQTVAGVLMANGIVSWRTTTIDARPRGLFCGIGVCFDCIVQVNDQRDVRAYQRRCKDGDVIVPQHDELPVMKSND